MPPEDSATGISRNLTSYADPQFSSYLRRAFLASSGYDRTDRLAEITIPTLLTGGEFDEITPATVEYYHSLIPGSQMAILKNCAHITMHEDLEADIKNIRDFLAQVENK